MTCVFCGCSEFDPCIDFETGETCAWGLPAWCNFCNERALASSAPISTFILIWRAGIAHQLAEQIGEYPPPIQAEIARLYEATR